MGVFKDGPDLYCEGLAALVALVGPDPGAIACQLADAVKAPAMGANRALGPQPCLDIGIGGFFVMELGSGDDGNDESPYGACSSELSGYVKCDMANQFGVNRRSDEPCS